MKRLIVILVLITFVLSSMPAFAAPKMAPAKDGLGKRAMGFVNGLYDWFGKMGKPSSGMAKKGKGMKK
ncbi:MAG: hypothetical protein JW994_01905 [Candidatus Omnitrophica bacterium]|nr:hypothetical protein [Candidatus Omnitrophota bacterium]